ncbi:hypothetical protein DID88_001441 [Monilinia fructigena]|uniref:Right handed beta helix domain-containing protein n=1 Tax=Monilinia fructigena TaxID=38457 RepID=A0A395IX36_9HELO|nr:hypothetical protein DID88_001441 [Monilinia fructigena]
MNTHGTLQPQSRAPRDSVMGSKYSLLAQQFSSGRVSKSKYTDVRPVGFEFSSLNTDGADTIYADNITFRGWTVDNGDDSISMKANSTNILIEDCDFHTGLGVAIGSIGQYENKYEIIENITARNIRSHNMRYGVYMKTWTGISTGYPPNGGGAGLGYASNMTFSNFTLYNNTGIFAITQCTPT